MDEFDRILSGIVNSTLSLRSKLIGYQSAILSFLMGACSNLWTYAVGAEACVERGWKMKNAQIKAKKTEVKEIFAGLDLPMLL